MLRSWKIQHWGRGYSCCSLPNQPLPCGSVGGSDQRGFIASLELNNKNNNLYTCRFLVLHSIYSLAHRAGGSKIEVARPAAKMLSYKLFMRRLCPLGTFFLTFFTFGCNTECSNFRINCKCNQPQANCKLAEDAVWTHVAPRRAQICAGAADVHKPIPFWF